jgi:hypothetical protein
MSRRWKRNRQTPATPSGQWCGRPREMLESAAYRVLSRAGHQVLSRIELELRYHAGKENGRARSRSKILWPTGSIGAASRQPCARCKH